MNIRERRLRRTPASGVMFLWMLALILTLWHASLARADGGASNLVYVAGAGADGKAVAIVDISNRSVSASVPLDAAPAGVVLSVDGRFAYLTQPSLDRVTVLDAAAKKVVATIPVAGSPTAIILVQTATATELFVALSRNNAVAVLDADARHVLETVQVGSEPVSLSLAGAESGIADPNNPEVYVACAGSHSVAVLATENNQVVASLPLAASPTSVVAPATGGVAYVTTDAGTIEGIALATRTKIGVIYQRSGARFGVMDYDAITGQVYVPDAASGTVDVLAPIAVSESGGPPSFPHEPARVLAASGGPSAVAITFDGSFGFIARRAAGAITMLDPASHQELATIGVGGAPAAMVTGPYPPQVSGQTAFAIDIAVIGVLLALMAFAILSGVLNARRKRVRQSVPPATE
jgi:YVTN family beta-propeller protein